MCLYEGDSIFFNFFKSIYIFWGRALHIYVRYKQGGWEAIAVRCELNYLCIGQDSSHLNPCIKISDTYVYFTVRGDVNAVVGFAGLWIVDDRLNCAAQDQTPKTSP